MKYFIGTDKLEDLYNGKIITILLQNITFKVRVVNLKDSIYNYYLSLEPMFWEDNSNQYILEVFGVCAKNKFDFFEKIIGYIPKSGDFPVVKNKKDLFKIMQALETLYDKNHRPFVK